MAPELPGASRVCAAATMHFVNCRGFPSTAREGRPYRRE